MLRVVCLPCGYVAHTIMAVVQGGGFSWLLPLQDGAPPIGWADAIAYLSLPVLLVVSQFVSQKLISPPQSNDPSQQSSQWILKFLPFMIGKQLKGHQVVLATWSVACHQSGLQGSCLQRMNPFMQATSLSMFRLAWRCTGSSTTSSVLGSKRGLRPRMPMGRHCQAVQPSQQQTRQRRSARSG